jgi:L-iditol 2-dehydrogenase
VRVAVYYNNSDIRIEERPKPQIGPEELLIQVEASGICGSDVMEWYRIKKAPLVLGHEISGIIEKTGKNVKKYRSNSQSNNSAERYGSRFNSNFTSRG